MTDDAARAELERRVAERLDATYKATVEAWFDHPQAAELPHVPRQPHRDGWLAVAREALVMAERVGRHEQHWGHTLHACSHDERRDPPVGLSAAIEEAP